MLPGMNLEIVTPLEGLATVREMALEAILGITTRVGTVGGDPGSLKGGVLVSREMRSATTTGLVTPDPDGRVESTIIAEMVRNDSVSVNINVHGDLGGGHLIVMAHVRIGVHVGPVIHVRIVRVAQEAVSTRGGQARGGVISGRVSIVGVRHYE